MSAASCSTGAVVVADAAAVAWLLGPHLAELRASAAQRARRDGLTSMPSEAAEVLAAFDAASVASRRSGGPAAPRERIVELVVVGGLTVAEAAGKLGVTPQQVRRLIDEGRLVAARHGKAWLLDADSVSQRVIERGGN